MNLETMSWIAVICAVPVMLLTWLFRPKEFVAFCKNWWGLFFFISVIVVLIVAWIRGWFNWLAHPVTLQVWVLILLVFLGLLIAFAIWLVGNSLKTTNIAATKPNWPPPLTNEPAQPAKPDWHNFIHDEIFGVLWRWSYYGNTINDSSLVAFCPRDGCLNRLESGISPENPHFYSSGLYGPSDTMKCNRCGFIKHFDCDHPTLLRRVVDEIERLVNTGQYVQRLK